MAASTGHATTLASRLSVDKRPVRVSREQGIRDVRVDQKPPDKDDPDPRSQAGHDKDRIYYSAAFRRLAEVTQVLTPSPGGFLTHNRLTHSLKVAQVARCIAETLINRPGVRSKLANLGGLDVEVTEAAALAHDLGHPPFGHIGEVVLDSFARSELGLPDGFEGNAQSFRIVTRLEPRSKMPNGLNLTRATRSAVLKYPWGRAQRRDDHDQVMNEVDDHNQEADRVYRLHWAKFGTYIADSEAFDDARKFLPPSLLGEQSVEAAIMDVADDITYAIHDLEDFYLAEMLDIRNARDAVQGFITTSGSLGNGSGSSPNPLDSLQAKLRREYPKRFKDGTFVDAARHVVDLLAYLIGKPGHRLLRTNSRHFVSKLITIFIGGITINTKPSIDRPSVVLDDAHWHQVQILKEITRRFVVQRTDVALVQRGQQVLLRELLEALSTWCEDGDEAKRLPDRLREERAEFGQRAIIDYAAGLTDHQAIKLHKALTGGGPASPELRYY